MVNMGKFAAKLVLKFISGASPCNMFTDYAMDGHVLQPLQANIIGCNEGNHI
jgi:hypothetical protein